MHQIDSDMQGKMETDSKEKWNPNLWRKLGKSEEFDSCDRPSDLTDIEIWWMTSKNNRVHFLYYIKLCALFQIHRWIQTGVILRRRQITVKIGVVCPVWPWKLTDDLEMDERDDLGHLFNSNSSFVHHSIAINESKLELQTGNTQFGSKSMIFLFRVALKFQKLPWKTIGHIVCATSNFAYNFIAIG